MKTTEIQENKKITRTKRGVVVSDKMDKTVVVAVNSLKQHSKYKKRYLATSKFKAHDEKNEFKIGDKVSIKEVRPLSKDKRWKVVTKLD